MKLGRVLNVPCSRLCALFISALCLAGLNAALPAPVRAQAPSELKQRGYVNDFGGFLSADDSTRISDVCRKTEEQTGFHLLVVTVQETGALTPGQFGEALRNSWFLLPDDRERAMLIVITGEGKIGVGIGKRVESVLTREQFEAALHDSLAIVGADYGPKLLYLVQHLSVELESAGKRVGETKDFPILIGIVIFGMAIWMVALFGSARQGAGPARLVLMILPAAFLYFLNNWFGPIEGQSDGVRLYRMVSLGLVFCSWIVGIVLAAGAARRAS